LFTRQPDYFDGEIVPAKVIALKDSVTKRSLHYVEFVAENKTFRIKADYPLRLFVHGVTEKVIFEKEHPEKAQLYRFWGYWIGWGELLGSLVLLVLGFQLSVAITKNPTPEALLEQLDYKEPNKPRYD
jgi:hypothetical protein